MQFTSAQRNLLGQLCNGQFHSGSGLARQLNLSRTAIWKLVGEYQALGLEIHAVPGKGYRLARPMELLDTASIQSQLSSAAAKYLAGLEIHDQLASTNTYLVQQARLGAPRGQVCLAEYQSAGRGRIGRLWHSPFAGNICLSLLWQFDDQSALAGLSLAVGVAVIRALRQSGVTGVQLKWPNDILWQRRKLGGILLEVSGEAHSQYAVVIGLGLNGYIPAQAAREIDQEWVDLAQITGPDKALSRNLLVSLLLNELLPMLAQYAANGIGEFIEEWRSYDCYHGVPVILHQGEHLTRGVVAGVDEQGLLLLDCEDGRRRRFASGEVRLRPDDR